MRKYTALVVVLLFVAVSFTAQAALTPAQKADLILASASNGNGKATSDPAVQTAPATAESYMLKYEKLSEKIDQQARRQKALASKIAGKADKDYVDDKDTALRIELYGEEGTPDSGVIGELKEEIAGLKKRQDGQDKKITAVDKKADEAKRKADAAYAEGDTTRWIAIAAMIVAIFIGSAAIFYGYSNKPSEADAKVKAKEKADAKAEAEAKAKAAADARARAAAGGPTPGTT